MNFIKKAVVSIFLINSIVYGADQQEQKQIWKTLQFPTIKTVEGQGQIKHFERVNLNTVDSITKKPLKRLIAEQWGKELPWVLATTLEVDDDGVLWRNYFDAHAINQWLLDDQYQRIAGRGNPTTARPIITLDYFSINHADKEFKHLGTLSQLIKSNPPKVRLFLQASEGNAQAMHNLGFLLEKKDVEGAKEWYEKAAALGNAAAMNNFGTLLEKEKDKEGAKVWYEKAIALSNADAMTNLGRLLHQEKNIAGAKVWYEKAIALGNVAAMNNFGSLLEEKDKEGAKVWYEKAAVLGNVAAMYNLGILLYKEDKAGAKEWAQKAANLNHRGAMNNLGFLLEEEENILDAYKWYKKAAKDGSIISMLNIVYLYGKGLISFNDTSRVELSKYIAEINNPINVNVVQRYKDTVIEDDIERWIVIQAFLDSFKSEHEDDDIPAAVERRKR
jgi:TPR repeat protein